MASKIADSATCAIDGLYEIINDFIREKYAQDMRYSEHTVLNLGCLY